VITQDVRDHAKAKAEQEVGMAEKSAKFAMLARRLI
jgi:hypothetical protein